MPASPTPAFADADLQFEARRSTEFGSFPVAMRRRTSVAPLPTASGVVPTRASCSSDWSRPSQSVSSFSGAPKLAGEAEDKLASNKYLPRSYRRVVPLHRAARRGRRTDDRLPLRDQVAQEGEPRFRADRRTTVSWGQIYAYCLRHPELARRVGLVREASFGLQLHDFEHGGFSTSASAAAATTMPRSKTDATFLKRYAARIPALNPARRGSSSPPCSFPCFSASRARRRPPGISTRCSSRPPTTTTASPRSCTAMQPVSQNLLAEDPDGVAPVTDIGIRLGWDDEQLLIWQNRQLMPDKTVPEVAASQRLDAPMGVFGYRIDARLHPELIWHSLVEVRCRDTIRLGDDRARRAGDPSP